MHLAMFIDGWNMYWSLKRRGIRPYGWCDFKSLARQQTGHADASVSVKFFTSDDKPNPDKPLIKQAIWWQALGITGCEVILGEFRARHEEVKKWIRDSGKVWREKQTDVALASHMVADCSREPGYDEAILLTQDFDFIPAVKIVANEPFRKRVHVLLPPTNPEAERSALREWKRVSAGCGADPRGVPLVRLRQLSKDDFAKALLPQVVKGAHGETVTCPATWMWRERYKEEQDRTGAHIDRPH